MHGRFAHINTCKMGDSVGSELVPCISCRLNDKGEDWADIHTNGTCNCLELLELHPPPATSMGDHLRTTQCLSAECAWVCGCFRMCAEACRSCEEEGGERAYRRHLPSPTIPATCWSCQRMVRPPRLPGVCTTSGLKGLHHCGKGAV